MWPFGRRKDGVAGFGPPLPVPTDAVDHVVAESTAVVTGGSALRFAAWGQPIPGWAWLNALAHQRPDELTTMVAALRSSRRPPDVWMSATVDILAALRRVGAEESEAIRAAVIVPAELEVLAGTRPADPGPVVRSVRRWVVSCDRKRSSPQPR